MAKLGAGFEEGLSMELPDGTVCHGTRWIGCKQLYTASSTQTLLVERRRRQAGGQGIQEITADLNFSWRSQGKIVVIIVVCVAGLFWLLSATKQDEQQVLEDPRSRFSVQDLREVF